MSDYYLDVRREYKIHIRYDRGQYDGISIKDIMIDRHLQVYHGMFNNFDMDLLVRQPYSWLYQCAEFNFSEGRNFGLGRVPVIHWGTIEYQIPYRFLRQFGMI